MQLRSIQSRKEGRIATQLAIQAAIKAAVAKVETRFATAPPKPVELPSPISLSRVRTHLASLDSLMSRAKTDREWDNLSRAYERLFKVWCVLSQTPGPGNRRPVSEKQARASLAALPSPAIPDQPQVSPARAVSPQPTVAPASTAPTASQPDAIEDPQREA